jgi:hypothetical protein
MTPQIAKDAAGVPQRIAERGFLGMALATKFLDRDPARAFLYQQIAALNPPATLPAILSKVGSVRVDPARIADFAVPTRIVVGTDDAFSRSTACARSPTRSPAPASTCCRAPATRRTSRSPRPSTPSWIPSSRRSRGALRPDRSRRLGRARQAQAASRSTSREPAPLSEAGRVRYAGPLLDDGERPCGSVVVFEAESLEAARRFAASDPYVVQGISSNTKCSARSRCFRRSLSYFSRRTS